MAMTNIREKSKKRETLSFIGQQINVGIDVHKKNWSVSVYIGQEYARTFHQESNGAALLKHLQTNYPAGIYRACYEAGFCGFSLQRELTSLGIECHVVNPSDVPQTSKGLLSKTDASDSRRLGEAFSKNMLRSIYIHKASDEADRNLIRYRKRVQEDLRAKKQTLKSLLNIMGIIIPVEHDKSYWTNNFVTWLKDLEVKDISNRNTLTFLVEDVLLLRKRLLATNKQIRVMSQTERYIKTYSLLTTTPGIGLITAMSLLTEVGDINRFDNFSKFNSFVGFCPSEFSSGEHVHKGKITIRCHKTIRSLILEAAWIAMRCDPALTIKYHELLKIKTAKRAIIIIARKLLSRLFTVWKTNTPYEKGILK